MSIAEIREICLTFPAVTEDIKWENHLCFNIGGKMFLVTAPDNVPVSASFKTSDEDFQALPNRPGFIPAPYMAHNKWIFVDDINRFARKDWETYLRKSYNLILSKLSLKFQKEVAEGKAVSKSAPKKKLVAVKKKKPATKKKVVDKKKVSKKVVRNKRK
ncbi:MAG TPA: MmcQ/YjbR family DNA-binding protein [Cyclobacteriaceae bacterium]|nr:MmcQ/YjbR family DNA-binding protein [Cyclobacteriaceae bacterium]